MELYAWKKKKKWEWIVYWKNWFKMYKYIRDLKKKKFSQT